MIKQITDNNMKTTQPPRGVLGEKSIPKTSENWLKDI